jgi:D-arginine dehydrogenase
MTRATDFVVIGGGIAGASAAYALQRHGSVTLLERERLPGQHTTGRSAAFWIASYGDSVVARLTAESRAFLMSPPDGFSEHPVVHPRPSLQIARPEQCQRLADDTKLALDAGVPLEMLSGPAAEQLCPILRPGSVAAAVLEPGAMSIDVAGLLDGYVRGLRARGGVMVGDADVTEVARVGESWEVRCGADVYGAAVVVNAAGAWGEHVGALAGARPVGLRPLRRTAITFDPPSDANIRDWPCVIDADEAFYIKPEGAQLLASPCDEEPSDPCDPSPDEVGIALAAERVQQATTLPLPRINRSWAGLRSFVADRRPVIGMDAELPGFFWLVGQGGFGIMTSPAASEAAASLIVHGALPTALLELGVREGDLSPEREGLARG